MRQGGAHIPKGRRKAETVCRAGECIGRRAPALQFERHHVAPLPLEQIHGAGVVGMVLAGRIDHALDARQAGEVVGQCRSRGLAAFEPKFKRQHAAQSNGLGVMPVVTEKTRIRSLSAGSRATT